MLYFVITKLLYFLLLCYQLVCCRHVYLINVFRKVCADVRKLLIFKRVSIILRSEVAAVFIRLNPGLERREVSFTKILCRQMELMSK